MLDVARAPPNARRPGSRRSCARWADQRELVARYGCPLGTLCSELDKRDDGLDRDAPRRCSRLPIDWAERPVPPARPARRPRPRRHPARRHSGRGAAHQHLPRPRPDDPRGAPPRALDRLAGLASPRGRPDRWKRGARASRRARKMTSTTQSGAPLGVNCERRRPRHGGGPFAAHRRGPAARRGHPGSTRPCRKESPTRRARARERVQACRAGRGIDLQNARRSTGPQRLCLSLLVRPASRMAAA